MPTDLAIPFVLFATRQGGGSPYTTFASDMDDDFDELQTWGNSVTAELRLLSGRDAPLGSDAILTQANATGRIGQHSALVTGSTGTATTISAGVLYTGVTVGRMTITGGTTTASGQPAGTLWLAADSSGNLTWETAALQQEIDLYSRASWNGSSFTVLSDEVEVAAVLPDGDEQELARTPGGGLAADFPVVASAQLTARISLIETFLQRNRIRSEAAAFSLAHDALTSIATTTASGNVYKSSITHTNGTTDHVIPAGGAGLYEIEGFVFFDESTSGLPNTGDRREIRLIVNPAGSADLIAGQCNLPAVAGDTMCSAATKVELADADVVVLRAQQENDNNDAMAVNAALTLTRIGPAV